MLSTKQRFRKMKSALKLNSFYKSSTKSTDDEATQIFHDCVGSCEKLSKDTMNTDVTPTWSSSGYNSGRTSDCESENTSTVGGIDNDKSECNSNPSGSEKRIKIKRNVQFNHTVAVRSIPSRKELAPMFRDIWYTGPECESFKRDAYFEMKNYIDKHKCSIKQAMLDLHQPEEELVDVEDEMSLATLYSAFDKWATDHLNFTSPRIMSKENSFSTSSSPDTDEQLLQRRQERDEQDEQDHNCFSDLTNNSNKSGSSDNDNNDSTGISTLPPNFILSKTIPIPTPSLAMNKK